jgi:hypothetical protein
MGHDASVQETLPVAVTLPSPVRVTVRVSLTSVKVAPTFIGASPVVIMQGPVPVQPIVFHAKVDPVSGVAVSVTVVPLGITAEQAAPHENIPLPAHDAVTVPVPLPSLTTMTFAFLSANEAVTCVEVVTFVSVHDAPLALVQPDQSVKLESAPGFAVSTRLEPTSTMSAHDAASMQLTPEPVTVPLPLRWIVTLTCGTWTFVPPSSLSLPPPSPGVPPSDPDVSVVDPSSFGAVPLSAPASRVKDAPFWQAESHPAASTPTNKI